MSKACSNGNYFNRDAATDAITNAPGAASALSMSCWYHASAFGQVHQPVSMGENTFDFLFVIEVNTGGAVRAYTVKGSTGQTNNTASTALSTNTWTHLAATWDGSTVRMYINGVEVANVAGTITAQQAINYLECGYVNGGTNVTTMQDVTHWGAALSADEIMLLYRERMPRRRANLVTNWPMFPITGNQADLAGNANTGVLNGTVGNGASDPSAVWSGNSPRRVYIASAIPIVPTGTTNVTGTASVTSAAGLAPTGTTQVTGAASMTKSAPLAAAGTTNVTGAATIAASAGLAPSGLTQVSGAAAMTKAAGLAPTGTTNVTGAAAVTAAAGVAGAGSTQCTGVATMTSSAALAATGVTQTTGSAALAGTLVASGSTQVSGAASLTMNVAENAAGTTQVTGTATVGITYALTATGETRTSGAASASASATMTAAGVTQVSGLASFAGGGGGGVGGVNSGTQSTRRFSHLVGRRRVR
jgi:hypothetical protein